MRPPPQQPSGAGAGAGGVGGVGGGGVGAGRIAQQPAPHGAPPPHFPPPLAAVASPVASKRRIRAGLVVGYLLIAAMVALIVVSIATGTE